MYPTDTLIHLQGKLLAAAPAILRSMEELLQLHKQQCPKDDQNLAVIKRAQALIDAQYEFKF